MRAALKGAGNGSIINATKRTVKKTKALKVPNCAGLGPRFSHNTFDVVVGCMEENWDKLNLKFLSSNSSLGVLISNDAASAARVNKIATEIMLDNDDLSNQLGFIKQAEKRLNNILPGKLIFFLALVLF